VSNHASEGYFRGLAPEWSGGKRACLWRQTPAWTGQNGVLAGV